MIELRRVTVFCGSSPGHREIFLRTAFRLGNLLASKGVGVVYGGAKVGLMGAVADGALAGGGEVTGVLPRFLRTVEIEHTGLSEIIFVESMHERKSKMEALSDGVIALPGGFGTLEELFEILTWAQLGLHRKPIGLLNVEGFFDPLIAFLDSMVDKGFLKASNRDIVLIENTSENLLERMQSYDAPVIPKWITKSET